MRRAFILGLVLCALAGAEEKVWNFDGDKAGELPAGFSAGTGKWAVAADAGAPSKPSVLAQTAENDNSVFNLAVAEAPRLKDVDLSVQFKSVGGETDQGGGVVWRLKDDKNYYVARYNPLEFNYRLYHILDGKRTQLQSAKLMLPEGWHSLRVTMSGEKIECFLDGKKYLEAVDGTFKEAGKVGLWTKADAQTHFDDLKASGN